MSAFKDAVANDVTSVFLNVNEFADVHEVQGIRVHCVIDEDLVREADASLEGVFINALTIYLREGDIDTPVEGSILSVDGSMHLVRSVSNEGGMLVIVAEANEQ